MTPNGERRGNTYSNTTTKTLHPRFSASNSHSNPRHCHQRPHDNMENSDKKLYKNSNGNSKTWTTTCHRVSMTSRKPSDAATSEHNDMHKLSETPNKTQTEQDSGNRPRPKQRKHTLTPPFLLLPRPYTLKMRGRLQNKEETISHHGKKKVQR